MDKKPEKLIFVYNADSSVFSQVTDAIKKVVTPDKYQCNLCMITYGPASMKDEWKKFLETLPMDKEFLHKDEFKNRFSELSKTELPAIFISSENKTSILASAKEIDEQNNLHGLIEIIRHNLQTMYPLRV